METLMNERQDNIHSQAGRIAARAMGWLARKRSLALFAILLVGAGAVAAVLTPTVPPTFCTSSGCYTTLDKAEAAMRNAPAYAGVGQLLEHMQTVKVNATTVRMQYWLRDRPVETLRAPSYYAVYGTLGNGLGTCALGDDQTALPGWCADEQTLVNVGLARIQNAWASAGCTITGNAIVDDYEPPALESSPTTFGNINYGHLNYRTTGTCASGATIHHNWDIRKRQPVYCRQGFGAIAMDIVDVATLATANLCAAENDDVTYVAMPVLQCGSCAGSRHPVYPATGEKQRAEPDFAFAGQTFTRYYRSIRQFRNNRSFAVAWNHTWSDRIISGAVAATPYVHIDESGSYESYALLSGIRYRGQNSLDRVLERTNANGVLFTLRLPDGELREFGADGYLIAVRNPHDPLNDVTITYTADKAMSTVTDAQGRVLRFEYSDNLLQRIVLPDGTDVAYGYDDDLNLTDVIYSGGAVRRYHYNEAALAGAVDQHHHLTGITSEDGRRFASFGYDVRGRVTSSRVLGTPNELTTVSYPTEDSAIVQTAEGGSDTYAIEPGVFRRILAKSDGAHSDQFAYDPEGRLLRATDKRGTITEYSYLNGYQASETVAVGTNEQRREEVDRDPATGQVIEQRILDKTGAVQAKTAWSYNPRGQITAVTVTDPATNTTRTATTTYCEAADVAAADSVCPVLGLVRNIDGARDNATDVVDVTAYEYRPADDPACTVVPAACGWRKGDLWKTIDAKGQVTEILAYDGAGRVTSIRDANGVVVDVEYSPRGGMAARKLRGTNAASEADDRIERIDYTADGLVQRVTQPDGVFITFGYDAGQRLTTVTDGDGNNLVYTLNAAGERVKEDTRDSSGALQQTLSRAFDTLGRLQALTDADNRSTSFAYDQAGLLKTTTDALGRQTTHDYDALGRPTRTLQNATDAAQSAEIALHYDALDRLTRVTDPKGLHTDYLYNGFGELIERRSPDTGTTTSTYDASGNATEETDANGKLTRYRYDALDRLKMVDYDAAVPDEAFAYDVAMADCPAGEQYPAGRLGRMTDASGSTAWCYNRFGELTRKVQRTGGRTMTLRWVYQADGRVQKTIYPGNTEVDYRYDTQGRINEIGVTGGNGRQVLLKNASYQPFGEVRQWLFGNDLALRRTVNLNGQSVAVEDGPQNGTGTGIRLGYAFDEVGNLKSVQSGRQGSTRVQTYGYDGLNRLTEVKDVSGVVLESYTYDRTGNRQTAGAWVANDAGGGPGGGTPTFEFQTEQYSYASDSHRLLSVGSEPREYDAAGNLKQLGDPALPGGARRMFAYNDANRMGEVSRLSGVLASYVYNGMGERVRRTVNGFDTYTLYDPDGRWLGDFNSAGSPVQMAIWLGDLPVGLLVGAGNQQKLYYIEADALGSPRAVIDPQRNVAVWRWDAVGEAFGHHYPSEDPDGDGVVFNLDMRFPGQQYDSVTGFHYNYFRDYDPGTGRYVQSDPIGLDGGISTYGYANGSPTMYSDPDGLIVGRIALQLATRFVLPRLGMQLGARAAVRATRAKLAQHVGVKVVARRAARRGTAKPLEHCASSSKALGQALEAAGYARPAGSAAHHIVAGTAKKAAPARAMLQRYGIGINEASNGVFLQTSVHARIHTTAYYEAVNIAAAQSANRMQLIEVLSAIRQSISSGGFP
jgi:RHS repeat-associated protein